jgi:hypothetical protein
MVGDIRRLLAGDTVEIEGAAARMLHWPGQAPSRPIEAPFVLGVNGPKGLETKIDPERAPNCGRPRQGPAFRGGGSRSLYLRRTTEIDRVSRR